MDHDQGQLRFHWRIVKQVLSLLSSDAKRSSALVVILVVVNAILDFFGIAAFLPLLFLVVSPQRMAENPMINKFYPLFRFSSNEQFIIAFAILLLAVIILKNVITAWIARKKAMYAFGISNDLASRAVIRYLEMSYLNFSEGNYSREVNRIVNYPLAFANHIILPLASLVSEVFVSVLILAAIAFYDWHIVAVLLLLFTPIVLLYRARRESLKGISNTLKEKYPLLMKSAFQIIEGFPEIKSTQSEAFFYSRFKKLNKEMTEVFAKDQLMQSGTTRLTELIVTVLICALIVYSVSFQQNYQQTLLLLGIYAGAAFRMIPSINRILHSTQQIRLHEHLLDELMPLRELTKNEFTREIKRLRFNDSIELRNISFAYPTSNKTLRDVSLSLRKGEKIAITGESGSGKTTLLLILLRLLQESEGQFLVDGESIIDEVSWRSLLGYVPQNPYILDGSVVENIAFGIPSDRIDRKKIELILDDLGLAEIVKQLPKGMDTPLGERGMKLSGGQRQRIAIARVLYADVEVLLLDEITNQVHSLMEEEILKILAELSQKGKTIIIVTHHAKNVSFFDSIYALEQGTLNEIVLQRT